ncbi:MAG: peptidoglycan DD-metalloendopeptidase family protein [Dethiobacter sp.]|nr:peptidoglycan DD-metalloendopeptidase family protein [Dethiobacter sp.]
MARKVLRLFVYILAGLLLIGAFLPVLANQFDEQHDRLDAVRDEQQRTQEELDAGKRQETTLIRELANLDNLISRVEAELRSLENKITDTERKISEAEVELAEAQERVDAMEELLGIRLRAIHENGSVSYLEVLFNSSSFTEFLTRYNDLSIIMEQDRELLIAFETEKERVETLVAALEESNRELLSLHGANLDKKQELEIKNREKEQLLTALRGEIEEREDAIRKLEDEAEEIEQLIKQLQAAQSGVPRGTGAYLWPLQEFGPSWITSGYGYRTNPITRQPGSWHGGIDIGIPHNRWPKSRSYIGKPAYVVASDSGIAYTYRMGSGYGNLVIIDHGGGVATVYAHNDSFLVEDASPVVKGQRIAIVGSTGFSTGPHLHFEIRINGERVNPLPYIR